MSKFNAHTHQLDSPYISLYSCDLTQNRSEIPQHYFFTIGLHPWWVDEVSLDYFEAELAHYRKHPHFLGIGEIGLDKTRENWEKQLSVFRILLKRSKEMNAEVLVIHCVRAYSDILAELKAQDYKGKILWHDFNGNKEILEQTQRFNSYYSLGAKLFNSKSRLMQSIDVIPRDRLLLETDDSTSHSLVDIYAQCSVILEIAMPQFKAMIQRNFTQLTGRANIL